LSCPEADGATVTVAASQSNANGNRTIDAVWLDSTNILRQIPNDGPDTWFDFGRDRTLEFSELREFLAENMIVPKRLLTIETQFPYTEGTRFVISGDCFIGGPAGALVEAADE
jgi:hypothetical protein